MIEHISEKQANLRQQDIHVFACFVCRGLAIPTFFVSISQMKLFWI
jgi:hypothetical protein